MPHSSQLLTSAVICLLLTAHAQGAAVTNLDEATQVIQLRTAAGFTDIPVQPGATWRMPGKVDLRYKGREAHLDDEDEYAIWTSGDFGPQKRTHRTGSID